jgi:putative endonuclease
MERYTVYILRCSDGSYYTGVTNDINRRLFEHNSGVNKESYTHSRRPVSLVFGCHFYDIEEAIALEKQIKGWTRKKKEAIINDNWDALPELSRCLNETSHRNRGRS